MLLLHARALPMFLFGTRGGNRLYFIMPDLRDELVEQGEGRLAEPVPWVRKQLGMIFDATGTRAKNTILCKSYIRMLSRVTVLTGVPPAACVLWVSFYYFVS